MGAESVKGEMVPTPNQRKAVSGVLKMGMCRGSTTEQVFVYESMSAHVCGGKRSAPSVIPQERETSSICMCVFHWDPGALVLLQLARPAGPQVSYFLGTTSMFYHACLSTGVPGS